MTTAELLQRRWGKQVRTRRGELRQSQTWLADAVGVDQTVISRIERGVYKVGPELMVGLAAALGCQLDALFEFPEGLMDREMYEREARELRRAAS